jgi:hypothetical protein
MATPETLENLLTRELSRRNIDSVVALIEQQPALFREVFEIFIRDEGASSRRAAWAADIFSEEHPGSLLPLLPELWASFFKFGHDGMKRHSLRMIARSPLPEGEQLGILITTCFDWLLSPVIAVAPKVHCMDILYRISELEPDLKKELADSIEWRISEETPGFRSHGNKVLTRLRRELSAKLV